MNILRFAAQLVGLTAKPRQIVVCGNSRGGTTMFYNMLRASGLDAFLPPREMSALRVGDNFHPLIITKRPLDIFIVKKILRRLRWVRDLHFVIVIRDPRSLVSSRHRSVRDQYFQGFDYTFFVADGRRSLTNPGVVDFFSAIEAALQIKGIKATVIKYEDLLLDSDGIQTKLAESLSLDWKGRFSDFHNTEIPDALQTALNGIRPVDLSGIKAWKSPEREMRVFEQFLLEPRLFSILERWGYEEGRSWFDELRRKYETPTTKRGKIIAFYTRDSFYEHEAQRMQVSASRHGLDAELTPVESSGSWVRNASMKARFLLNERKSREGPLLYVDVDAVFHADPWPYLSSWDGDLAVHAKRSGEILTGTVLINDTPAALRLLERWAQACDVDPETWDQRILQKIIENDDALSNPEFRIQRLPASLCWVFDAENPAPFGSIFIEHLQASRQATEADKFRIRVSKKLARRRRRVEQIEKELFGTQPAGQPHQRKRHRMKDIMNI